MIADDRDDADDLRYASDRTAGLQVLGILWCFCKCVFSLCCSVLLDDCR